jgi:hypothetical protein
MAPDVRARGTRCATRFEAVEPLRQGIRAMVGGYDGGIARGLLARHDHGSQYVSDYFQAELTLKEQLLWVRTFDSSLRHSTSRAVVPAHPN